MTDKEKRAVTMADIARLANVSKPTVSRALSNSPLVNKATRNHVLTVAAQHGYAVNRNAQKLRQKRTNTIAVSMDFRSHRENHISDPFMFDLLAGVSEALGDHNQDLLLCAPNHNDSVSFRQILTERGADGFVILGQGHREAMLKEFAMTGAPIVVWGAAAPDANYCVVGSDNFLGGKLAGEYFLEKGRRHFLFVGDTSFREMHLRREGLVSAIDESGQDILLDDIELHSFSYDSAYDAATRYLDAIEARPDAIFTWNDTAAMAFICAFREAGASVPGEVSVVGYNDIPAAQYFSPPVTTIRQDTHQAGRVLVAKLLRIIDGESPQSASIRTELIRRAS
ncbi:MAG: LacI family DNA-binding transcriptional regulator [Gammaproteobacteria bacterium]|nr:LacI family DNA-binding transcriptional regulator [Gammaproteobacteria bacterium]MDH4255003.1 LacI family DNA-binding transcriptional regulator [Gammaproteobacteria bacterium]MDH5311009.1 LacI family DNA-binding transcriptional regulator [Gammaproteobacteria bacterium]